MTTSIKLLGISGSLRRRSYNTALLRACYDLLPANVHMDIADLASIPMYNRDIDGEHTPQPVQAFRQQIANADGLLMATPEYNHSVSGALKNAIDWASRRAPGAEKTVLDGKLLGIMGAAAGQFGTVRAQQHLRLIAVATNMQVVQRPFVLVGGARDKFDDEQNLTDDTTRGFLQELVDNLVKLIEQTRQLETME